MGKITDYLVVCGKMNRLKARKVEILRTQKKDVKYEKKDVKEADPNEYCFHLFGSCL